jgi:hypothetical protein
MLRTARESFSRPGGRRDAGVTTSASGRELAAKARLDEERRFALRRRATSRSGFARGPSALGVVDGADDLGVVDPSEIHGGDCEVGVTELSLYDKQRDTLARHLYRVRVAKLVRRDRRLTPARAAAVWSCARTPAGAHGRPRVGPRRMQNNAPTGREERRATHGASWSQGPAVHPDFATLAAFAASDQDRASAGVEVALGERERLADPQTSAPEHDNQAAESYALGVVTAGVHDGDDLLDAGWVCRVAQTLVFGAGAQHGRRAASR